LVGWLFNSTSTQKGQFVPTDAGGKMSIKFHYFPVNLAKFCVYFYVDLPILSILDLYNIITMNHNIYTYAIYLYIIACSILKPTIIIY